MSDDMLSHLNPQQRAAVEYNGGPVLVLAGAGSGKTRVITHKYSHVHKNMAAQEGAVLAVTFTNKAARELKLGIGQLVCEDLENGLENDPEHEWIGTFHSQCTRILRKEIGRLGLRKNFVVYDADDQSRLIRHILNDMKEYEALYKGILSKINCFKSSFVSPDEQISNVGNFAFDEKLRKVYSRYKDELRKSNALDCDDLILFTIRLFEEHPDVLEKYQDKFAAILVDEFQDTSYAQYHLLALLAGQRSNIMVAGDDDQSIYKFKGAESDNILAKFEKDFSGLKIIKLEQGYRCSQTILNASHGVISKNSARKHKSLWTDRGTGEKVCHHWFDGEIEESRYVAKTLKELYLKGNYCYGDMAVFYRVPLQSKSIEEALKNERIPYKVTGACCVYQHKEIKDVISYLRLIVNKDDNVSIRRIINNPNRGIGITTLNKLESIAKKEGVSLYQAMKEMCGLKGISQSAREKVSGLIDVLDSLTLDAAATVSAAIKLVGSLTGYLDSLNEARLNLVSEMMLVNKDVPLVHFLDEVSLATSSDDTISKESVTLTTLHNVKGLEFAIVFITGLEDGLLPYFKATKEEELDEERRLLYVGMTRAKDFLFMTGAKKRKLYAKFQEQEPSRFLNDVPRDFCLMIEKKPVISNSLPARIRIEPEPPKEFPYNPGCRVKHSKWGVGVIRDCYGEENDIKVTVNFPNVGIKRLALKYANLERI